MTSLTLGLVAEVARLEVEERLRRAELRREVASRGGSGSGVRRWLATTRIMLASRRAPAPVASECPGSPIASPRATSM
jgi:hypothetical protein